MSDVPKPPLIEGLTTPIIFFDNVTNQGFANGIANIPLTTFRYRPGEGGKIRAEEVYVADLRCSLGGLHALKAACENALLLAATNQSAQGPKN